MSVFATKMAEKLLDEEKKEHSMTENGATGFKTSGSALVNLNFALSSMRNMSDQEIWGKFLAAYNEDPILAMLWLFFARCPRGGAGERDVFRAILARMADENPSLAQKVFHLVPEYGRWDDLVWILDKIMSKTAQNAIKRIISEQFYGDMKNMEDGQPISLLAKWLPSANASSMDTKRRAEIIRDALELSPRKYRKSLSALRAYLDVTERKMSAKEWDKIAYPGVPSRAMMNYRGAFIEHDGERFIEYLTNVKSGEEKINSGVLYPHDIVHAYHVSPYKVKPVIDDTLEAQWKALPDTVTGINGSSTIVVVDGSGSMCSYVGDTRISAHEVARAIGLYFAEKLEGEFNNSFITFSARPQLVKLQPDMSLRAKLDLISRYDDCSNTNIEKVFDLILETAVDNHLKQEDIPANIMIISDQEFDAVASGKRATTFDQALFEVIEGRFKAAGYKLPRLVFWNVCSRTGTIPLSENELGVALVSGFSPSIADMVMSGELDPYRCLVKKLTSDRYKQVVDALKE